MNRQAKRMMQRQKTSPQDRAEAIRQRRAPAVGPAARAETGPAGRPPGAGGAAGIGGGAGAGEEAPRAPLEEPGEAHPRRDEPVPDQVVDLEQQAWQAPEDDVTDVPTEEA